MAEVRPWIDSRISLAKFNLKKECRLVNCSLDRKRGSEIESSYTGLNGYPLREPTAAEKEAGIWGDIAYAFSEPVSAEDRHLDYIPTQVLAELFKENGYDGIMYKSLLNEKGWNIALFDVGVATPFDYCLFYTKSISFEFAQCESSSYPEILTATSRAGG
jgi:hypothetical protein